MAFKLRLQIFFLILTVLPLLVGGWMIQRTVVESRRSSIDQRLAGGVGTLGAQYAARSRLREARAQTLPRNTELQQAIVDKNVAKVRRLADIAAGDGLRITVQGRGRQADRGDTARRRARRSAP